MRIRIWNILKNIRWKQVPTAFQFSTILDPLNVTKVANNILIPTITAPYKSSLYSIQRILPNNAIKEQAMILVA